MAVRLNGSTTEIIEGAAARRGIVGCMGSGVRSMGAKARVELKRRTVVMAK